MLEKFHVDGLASVLKFIDLNMKLTKHSTTQRSCEIYSFIGKTWSIPTLLPILPPQAPPHEVAAW